MAGVLVFFAHFAEISRIPLHCEAATIASLVSAPTHAIASVAFAALCTLGAPIGFNTLVALGREDEAPIVIREDGDSGEALLAPRIVVVSRFARPPLPSGPGNQRRGPARHRRPSEVPGADRQTCLGC